MPDSTIPLTDFEGTGLTAKLGRWWLRANGWSMAGRIPEPRRFVLIAAPHTSNWDLPYMLAIGWVYGIRVRWMGKHTLFKPPFGWLMRKPAARKASRRC